MANYYSINSTSSYMTSMETSTPAVDLDSSSSMTDRSVIWIFSDAYRPVHGWLSTFVCLFGIPANLLNIIVLTRPNLISSPTNLILTALAVSDLFTMLTSLVNTIYYNVIYVHVPSNPPSPERDTKFWVYFTQMHVMASVTFHSISIWLTVYLACFRYIYIASSSPGSLKSLSVRKTNNNIANKSTNNNTSYRSNSTNRKKTSLVYFFRRFLLRCRTYNFTLCGILNVCLFSIIFCSPAYIYPRVEVFNDTSIYNTSLANNVSMENIKYPYHTTASELDRQTNGLIFTIMFYTQAIFGKFLPCLLLVTFSSLLVHSLIIINRNNKKLIKADSSAKSKASTKSKNTTSPKKNGPTATLKIENDRKKDDEREQQVNPSSNMEEEGVEMKTTTAMKNTPYASSDNSKIRLNQKRGSLSVLITDQSRRFTRRLSEIRTMTRYFHHPIDQQQQQGRSVDRAVIAAAAVVTVPADGNVNTTSPRKSIMTNVSTIKKPKRNKAKENLRTTLMLTIVCVLFLITEFPQSILILLSILKGKGFYENVYMPLGDLIDMVALTNNSINFFLYCAMSRAFRNTFYNTMVSLWCCKFYKRFFVDKDANNNSCRPRRPTNVNSANFSLFTATACGVNNVGGSKPSSKNMAANSSGKADLAGATTAGAPTPYQLEVKSGEGNNKSTTPSVNDVEVDQHLAASNAAAADTIMVMSSSGYYNPDDERSGFLGAASLSMVDNSNNNAVRKNVVNFKYERDYDEEDDHDDHDDNDDDEEDEDNDEEGDYDENEI